MVNQRRMGVILSYISEAISVLSGLLYTPIMLRLLGQSEYGVYQLVAAVIAYLNLLSMGFSSAYIKFYSRYSVNGDKKAVAKLNGMFLTIFSVIALLCLVCGFVLTGNVGQLFGKTLTAAELKTASILMAIMSFNMALTMVTTVFTCIITAAERFVFQKCVLILKSISGPLITLPILFLGYGSIGMVTVTTCVTLAATAVNVLFCLKKLHVQFSFRSFDFSLLKEMWGFTFFIFLNMIIDQINWNVDQFILGSILGTTAVAVYGLAAQINTLYRRFSVSVSSVFIPQVHRIVAGSASDNQTLTAVMVKVGRIQAMVMLLVCSGFIVFGKEFIYFWAGQEYGETYYVTLLLIVPSLIPLIQNIGIEIQRAKNKHQSRAVVYFCIAVLNVIVSIPLARRYGAIGSALGTALGLTAGNIIFMNFYYHMALGLDMIDFWKQILKLLPALALPLASGYLLNQALAEWSIIGLFAKILCYTCVYCIAMWLFAMNAYEKSLLTNAGRKLLTKGKKR